MLGIGAIHAYYGDGEHAVFEFFYLAFDPPLGYAGHGHDPEPPAHRPRIVSLTSTSRPTEVSRAEF